MRLAVNFNTIRCMNNVILRTLTLLLILLKCVRIILSYVHACSCRCTYIKLYYDCLCFNTTVTVCFDIL